MVPHPRWRHALSSAISLLEALVAFARQRLGLTRRVTTLGMAALVFVAGIPSALAQGPSGVGALGRDVLTVVDAAASNLLLPLAGHHAALVVLAALVAVLVAEVDFHAGDLVAEPAQGLFHHRFDASGQLLAAFDAVVAIDLNVHGGPP
jgi:SNF family Na+-dependent transporter